MSPVPIDQARAILCVLTCGGFSIKPAKRAEYDEATDVSRMHLRAYKDCYGRFVSRQSIDQVTEEVIVTEYRRLRSEGYEMWVARLAGVPVGVAIFGADPSDNSRDRIEAVYVAPEWQRHPLTVGTRLLNKALGQLDHAEVVLDCATRNVGGRRFWQDNGFREDGQAQSQFCPSHGYETAVCNVLERGRRSILLSHIRTRIFGL
jgi:GNAT superfamily N-acetyltransferase